MLKEKIFVRQKNFSLYKEPLLKKKRLGWKNDLLKRKSWRKSTFVGKHSERKNNLQGKIIGTGKISIERKNSRGKNNLKRRETLNGKILYRGNIIQAINALKRNIPYSGNMPEITNFLERKILCTG